MLNSSLIERPVMRTDVKVVPIPMNEMAAKVGSALAINMVALGAYIKATDVVPLATVKTAMARMLEKDGKGEFAPMNEQALQEGYDAVQA